MRSIENNSPTPEEIGSWGYFRLLQHRYTDFLDNYWKVTKAPAFRELFDTGQGMALEDCCSRTLLLTHKAASSLTQTDPDSLAFQVFQETFEDGVKRINFFEDRFIKLLYGSEAFWIRQVLPDEYGSQLLEKAENLLDEHLDNLKPSNFLEILKTHQLYRDYMRSLVSVYNKPTHIYDHVDSAEKSLLLLDEEALEIQTFAIATGQNWI